MSAYVYRDYIERGLAPSTARLKTLISHLSSAIKDLRICIDGIDECSGKHQVQIISGVLPLAQLPASNTVCKVLFASRDIGSLSKHLAKYTTICLTEERSAIEPAIKGLISESLPRLEGKLNALDQNDDMFARIEHDLVAKAEGRHSKTSSLELSDNYRDVSLGQIGDLSPAER